MSQEEGLLRTPVCVLASVPGLLAPGVSVTGHDDDSSGVIHSVYDGNFPYPKALVSWGYPRGQEEVNQSLLPLDWSSQGTVEHGIRWLMDRGHKASWLRPTQYGGQVPPWEGLSALEVSAILVSVSVRAVLMGHSPINGFVSFRVEEVKIPEVPPFWTILMASAPTPFPSNALKTFDSQGEALDLVDTTVERLRPRLLDSVLLVPGGVYIPSYSETGS